MKKIILVSIIAALILLMGSLSLQAAELGDLNGDGEVNIHDCIVMAEHIVGSTDVPLEIADLNGDGEVSIMDLILLARFIVGEIDEFPVEDETPDDDMRDISTMELMEDMGMGWNLGNSLEACGDWIEGDSISDYETAWGNPVTTKEIIDGIADIGFNTVRIPVAWSNMMADDYTIHPELMDRVEEVANYVLDNDMYAVINIHWDGGWIEDADTDYEGTLEKYLAIWTQVSERFKDYSDYLLFESMNEEGVYDDVWNRYSGEGDKEAAYNILNNLNQEFVDLVRDSGGNNAERHLLIAGYATDVDLTIDDAYNMPDDPADRQAVSVHYYRPPQFTLLEEDADWGENQIYWGTESEIQTMEEDMEKLKTHFIDEGVPVNLGEYGAYSGNDQDSVRKYIVTLTEIALEKGIQPMIWDNGEHYDRETYSFRDSELESQLRELAD